MSETCVPGSGFPVALNLRLPRGEIDPTHWVCEEMRKGKRKGTKLDGGFKYFFSPLPGKMIQFDKYVSNVWNHQLEKLDSMKSCIASEFPSPLPMKFPKSLSDDWSQKGFLKNRKPLDNLTTQNPTSPKILKTGGCSHKWVSPKNSGFSPQIIHFNRFFHHFHHPFWDNPHFWKHPNGFFWFHSSCHSLEGFKENTPAEN